MKASKFLKRLLSLAIALVMLFGMISAQVAAAEDDTDCNQNDVSTPIEEWTYTPRQGTTSYRSGTTATIDEVKGTSGSSADIVKVHVTATDRSTGETVSVAGADVNLYVGTKFISSCKSGSDGVAEVSLAGVTAVQRRNATISASKVVSRGKAINGNARDDLFEHFPVDENGDYYRYTMELHSETIDENGNWCGEKIPVSYESNKVDIVFVIDATGSMTDEINNVKTNIASFSENLIASGLDIRFCIIDYRDITISEATNVHSIAGSHWLTDVDSVVGELSSITATGGGDVPETVLDPLGYVADNSLMSWRSDAYRFAFVLTDANYKIDNNYGYSSMSEVTAQLAKMDVITSVITSGSYKSTYSDLYDTTGGIYADINSATFDVEMLALSNSIIESVVREMTLKLSEPRMLVNMSVCYFADDKTSQSDAYRESLQNMLNEYSHRLAEATDGHIMIDKILLFSTNNRLNFYDTNNMASMADIQLQSEVKDDGKWWSNVKIHNNAFVFGFFTDQQITVDDEYMEAFNNLKDAGEYLSRSTFYRIISGGIDINGYSLIDDVYYFSATQAHETGHYLMGFRDEYQRGDGAEWDDVGGKPYNGNFGLMDNQYDKYGIEISSNEIEYAYMHNDYESANQLIHTEHSWTRKCSCEDTLAEWMTNEEFIDVYNIIDDPTCDFSIGKYASTYSKIAGNNKRTATYSYAELSDSDFLSPYATAGGGGGGGGRSINHAEVEEKGSPVEASFTKESVANVVFTGNEKAVIASVVAEDGYAYSVSMLKSDDEDFTAVELSDGKAELTIAKGELAEVRITASNGKEARYNTYYIDRSQNTTAGYVYTSADNAVMAYVTTGVESSYTFIADNTGYINGDYFSVNQATRISSDNGVGFDSGEIYSVANYLDEIDYTTLRWFKYADGKWSALPTDYSEEENMNIGARADLDGEGLYVLMAKAAPVGEVLPAENLDYTQSTDLDAVVTLTFDDPNTNSKYYNVYYSETRFNDKNAEGVVVRSFNADSTELTINLLERGRTVYAAVEIVLEDGSRSELSEIILIGGEADSDGDGIPDWYCDEYLLWGEDGEDKDIANSDDDGDGLTNLEEYLGGSDPTDPNDPVHTTNVPVESISVSATEVTLFIGKTVDITAIVMPENASNKSVSWSSADTDVATVKVTDGVCTITAVGAGKTQIYAVTTDGGYSASVAVTVEKGLPFVDVAADDWFIDAVHFVFEQNLMLGVSTTKFAPDDLVTRGMVVTVLHRMEGTPSASAVGFTDVKDGCWYTDAIYWTQANGIVEGYGDGTFRPDEYMTREELVAVFYRYAEHKGYDVSGGTALKAYSDRAKTQSYAKDAISWAVAVGLIQGFKDGTIRPQDYSNRAQLATVLMRFIQLFVE
ncbi:MAG: S-layer homology domain-containing protein [Faecousia sp.]